jgi:hypothetical protein
VIPSWVGALPPWLVLGILLGVASSVGVAGLFFMADRYFTARPHDERHSTVDERRRVEIRGYLSGIDERFVENHQLSGETVDFYLPDRGVAITFDPRIYYEIDRTDVYPVLLEHELPGIHIGGRLPFETPETPDRTLQERPEREVETAFAQLGVPADASADEVKDAYRRRVKQVHPDHGGDEQAFKQVQEAYTTAKEYASERTASS